ncbi:hypothetical protein [Rhizobium sp. LCM 4573]|uniref:hypothetical protein n=1 Tax=Rhizobium sp. LCM 4573 TaxID=1848291 RepID=UPI0008D967E4|nr:hypothetical protein [Rhizobium sp. LCM 4573]OHV84872.1 hypothetical protein LCM4573_04260 [Rhizobium sp. LCM 4573]
MATRSDMHTNSGDKPGEEHGAPKLELWKLFAAALFILLCMLTAMELFNGAEFGGTEPLNPPPHSIDQ